MKPETMAIPEITGRKDVIKEDGQRHPIVQGSS
jgi:hypothetical protein